MRHQLATRLLYAVGASTPFVDDVLGDLEEIAVERRAASQPSGALWYAGEVLRAVPHAVGDSVRGSVTASVVDVMQKAVAAWLLLAMVTIVMLIVLVVGHDAWLGSPMAVQDWARSNAFVVRLPLLLLVAVPLRYVMLGYVAAWMDAKRPLLTLLTVAVLDAFVHGVLVVGDLVGSQRLILPAVVWTLVTLGGLWRVFRGPVAGVQTPAVVATR